MSELVSGNPSQGDATPSPAPVAAPATPAAPAPAATPQIGAPPASATPSIPEGYVPSYRLREAREAAIRQAQEQWGSKESQYQAQLEQMQQQMRALLGVSQPANPQIEQVKQQFSQLYPGISSLEEKAQAIQQLLERSQELEQQNTHYWQSYGRQTLDRLFNKAQETFGQPLTDEAKRFLHSNFIGFIQSSPEMEQRYAQDPSIVEDFWRSFSSNFIDPARRVAAAGVQNRAPGALPQDTPSGAPRSTPPPQHAGLDDRVASAWAQYQQTANNHR